MNIAYLHALSNNFSALGLNLRIAPEIEFYVAGELTEAYKDACYEAFASAGIITLEILPEVTSGHYEIALLPIEDPVQAAENLHKVKAILTRIGAEHNLALDFSAKPYPDKPGSGLHIHVSLFGPNGESLFAKKGDAEETEVMLNAVAGLCATMPEAMVFFAPNPESYARFTAAINTSEEGITRHNNAPINISWGGNNRTTAIRIPTSTIDPTMRHIEHRVAGADADPEAVIFAVLAGIHHGIANKLKAPPKVYGNAYDPQYVLPELPKSLEDAQKLHQAGAILAQYFL